METKKLRNDFDRKAFEDIAKHIEKLLGIDEAQVIVRQLYAIMQKKSEYKDTLLQLYKDADQGRLRSIGYWQEQEAYSKLILQMRRNNIAVKSVQIGLLLTIMLIGIAIILSDGDAFFSGDAGKDFIDFFQVVSIYLTISGSGRLIPIIFSKVNESQKDKLNSNATHVHRALRRINDLRRYSNESITENDLTDFEQKSSTSELTGLTLEDLLSTVGAENHSSIITEPIRKILDHEL